MLDSQELILFFDLPSQENSKQTNKQNKRTGEEEEKKEPATDKHFLLGHTREGTSKPLDLDLHVQLCQACTAQ